MTVFACDIENRSPLLVGAIHICAALETLDLSIHDARIYSDTDGGTLDTFFVLKSDGSSLDTHPDTFLEIETSIRQSLSEVALKNVSRHTPRTVKAFTIPTTITFLDDQAGGLTTLEIVIADRPGLLARLGSVLSKHEVTIQGAKIQTLGERVEDIFFLTDATGGALQDRSLLQQLEQELNAELGAEPSGEALQSGVTI